MAGQKKYCLIAVLDWGLGHATRCVPVVETCINNGYHPVICAAGRTLLYLKQAFPDAYFYELPPLSVEYSEKLPFGGVLIRLLPRFVSRYFAERKLAKKLISKYRPDFIISDHCYGFYSGQVPSAILIHQLQPVLPFPVNILKPLVYKMHNTLLRRFNVVWIPDEARSKSLAGKLSEPAGTMSYRRTGWLSALKSEEPDPQYHYEVLAVLSGPEPFRTAFEEILTEQAPLLKKKMLIIQGLPEKAGEPVKCMSKNLYVLPFADKNQLNKYFNNAGLIVARSGYSTVMDLALLGKKALLVPTPRQTEQEHLAKHLKKENVFYSVVQSQLNITKDVKTAYNFNGFSIDKYQPNERLKKAVDDLKKVSCR